MEPIPSRILAHSITLKTCAATDVWQNPAFVDTAVNKVCMQPTHETRRTRDNTEVVLRSLLFADAVRSVPALDYESLQIQSESNGKPMQLVFNGNTYTVLTIDKLYDDTGRLHHWELGLV